MDTESIDKGISQGGRHWPGRVDWRSGEMANLRDDAFWHRQPALRELRASKRARHDTTNVDVLVMLCFGALLNFVWVAWDGASPQRRHLQ